MKVKYSSHIIILLLSFMVGGGTDLFGCFLVPCVCCSPTILFVPYYLIICFSVCVECRYRAVKSSRTFYRRNFAVYFCYKKPWIMLQLFN